MNFRAVSAGFKQQYTQFFADPQWVIPSLVSPFLFTMVMLFMYSGTGKVDGPIVLQAVLGGGVLGMWANTLFASSFTISYDRMNGTMESMMISPTGIFDILVGRSAWNTFIGLVNALAVFVVAEVMFGTSLTLADPVLFFVTLLLTLFSLSCVGMLIATAFVLTRMGRVLSVIAEYPIYVLSGALVPITVLPHGLQYVSYILAPAWGVDAIRGAAIGSGWESMFGTSIVIDLAVMLGLSAVMLVIAYFIMKTVERKILNSGSATRY
ncbi:MAG: ABC transporter permease [Candidatus Methanoplasma sp.]|jgi:ABC-2 type transport system permease protein|nr:ABC transporter permease [Candidatus Methanoplasma sp.]